MIAAVGQKPAHRIVLEPRLAGDALQIAAGQFREGCRRLDQHRRWRYALQEKGAKWPLLPRPARSRLRPKPCTCISFACASARRGLAGCPVLSMKNGSPPPRRETTPSISKANTPGAAARRV